MKTTMPPTALSGSKACANAERLITDLFRDSATQQEVVCFPYPPITQAGIFNCWNLNSTRHQCPGNCMYELPCLPFFAWTIPHHAERVGCRFKRRI